MVLDLTNEPSADDIRLAYRKKLLKVHPDINKNDPNANDKTRAVVEAYEVLTRGTFDDQDTKNQMDIGPIQVRFASEGDFVTATQFGGDGEDLYIGCYSGKTYLLLANGNTTLIYDAHAPIRKIKELGRYLYIISDHFWDVLLNRTLLNRVEGRFRFDRILLDHACNAVLINHKTVRLYSHGGIAFAEVACKENVADAFMFDQKLKVVTGAKSYIFAIQPPSDYNILTENQLCLP